MGISVEIKQGTKYSIHHTIALLPFRGNIYIRGKIRKRCINDRQIHRQIENFFLPPNLSFYLKPSRVSSTGELSQFWRTSFPPSQIKVYSFPPSLLQFQLGFLRGKKAMRHRWGVYFLPKQVKHQALISGIQHHGSQTFPKDTQCYNSKITLEFDLLVLQT